MQRKPERRYTTEDSFSTEESSMTKHEYFAGEIFAMTGASLRHNRITGNIYTALRAKLADSSGEVFTGTCG